MTLGGSLDVKGKGGGSLDVEGKGDGGGGVALCSPILCIHLVGVKKLCFNYSCFKPLIFLFVLLGRARLAN